MKAISLNEYLSSENLWAGRLLGFEPFAKQRDRNFVKELYDDGIWGERYEKHADAPEVMKEKILRYEIAGERVVSLSEALFVANSSQFQNYTNSVIEATINEFADKDHICELGCGIGTNLLRLSQGRGDRAYYGGELAQSGVKLGTLFGLKVSQFDYYQRADYKMIDEGTSVLTVHSIEQIPDARVIIENLSSVRSKIKRVIHFEPLANPERTSFFGLIRNRYKEMNDYNGNLLEVLRERTDVQILKQDFDVYGLNPLNPTSILVWEFID